MNLLELYKCANPKSCALRAGGDTSPSHPHPLVLASEDFISTPPPPFQGTCIRPCSRFGNNRDIDSLPDMKPKGKDAKWIKTSQYTLTSMDRECLVNPSAWMNDRIFEAAQALPRKQFQIQSFQVISDGRRQRRLRE